MSETIHEAAEGILAKLDALEVAEPAAEPRFPTGGAMGPGGQWHSSGEPAEPTYFSAQLVQHAADQIARFGGPNHALDPVIPRPPTSVPAKRMETQSLRHELTALVEGAPPIPDDWPTADSMRYERRLLEVAAELQRRVAGFRSWLLPAGTGSAAGGIDPRLWMTHIPKRWVGVSRIYRIDYTRPLPEVRWGDPRQSVAAWHRRRAPI